MSSETGVFWLASDPDTLLPGHLVFSDDGAPRLELHGQLTPSMKVVSHDDATSTTTMEPADEPTDLLVHGFLENIPRRVTLIDCATSGRQEVHALGAPLDQHELRARVMVRGAHVSGGETFTGVRLRVADIDSWAGLTPVRPQDQEGGVALGVPWHDLPTVETSKGAKLSVDEQISTSWGAR